MAVENYKYKKGEVLALDQIYDHQGLGGGRWWDYQDNDITSDNVVVNRNVEIQISVKFTG